jgi:Holliday junction resolvase
MKYKPRVKYQRVEHNIQSQVIEYLAYNGFKVWRNNVGAIRHDDRIIRCGKVGSSDVFAVKNGKFYSIEIKKPKGKVTEAQKQWLEDVALHGGVALVVRSLEELIDALN